MSAYSLLFSLLVLSGGRSRGLKDLDPGVVSVRSEGWSLSLRDGPVWLKKVLHFSIVVTVRLAASRDRGSCKGKETGPAQVHFNVQPAPITQKLGLGGLVGLFVCLCVGVGAVQKVRPPI